MKKYFENVNFSEWFFYVLIGMQVVSGYAGNGEYKWTDTILACLLLYGMYTIGRSSLDRELEIKLNKALKEIEADAPQN